MSVESLTSEDVQAEVLCNINSGANVIYWHHQLSCFMYMKDEDKKNYKQELKRLGCNVFKGKIRNVLHGEILRLENKRLYPMEVDYYGIKCRPYTLLGNDTNANDIEMLPYLYLNRKDHDRAVAFLLSQRS